VVSLAGHVVVLTAVAYAPAPAPRAMPVVVTVDLVASARPSAPAAARAASKPAPEALAPPPPPPPPAQKTIVLPKEAPEASAKPKARKESKEQALRPPRRPRPQELDYEDALAKLREEVGESAETAPAQPAPSEAEPAPEGSGGAGLQVPPEVARWIIETVRHVRSTYVTPPEFRGRGLRTCLTVLLTSDGRVMGEPRILGSSGDVYWDDNAVRATLRASPLPPPPQEGDWTFCFPTEDRN